MWHEPRELLAAVDAGMRNGSPGCWWRTLQAPQRLRDVPAGVAEWCDEDETDTQTATESETERKNHIWPLTRAPGALRTSG
jgi:hypothetical protein